MSRQILKNLCSNYLATAVGAALGFFLVPFLIRRLGKEAFGVIVLAESAIAFFEILTISIRMALSRHAAFSLAKGDFEGFVQYLATGRRLLWVSTAFIFSSGIFMSAFFPSIFRVPPGLGSQSRLLSFWIAAAFSLSIPFIIYWSVLYAKQRFDLINLSLSIGLIARALCLFVVYSVLPQEHRSLAVYGTVYFCVTAVQNGLIYFYQKKLMPFLSLRGVFFESLKAKEILTFGFHTSVSRVSSLFSNEALNVLINLFWGAAFNAFYSVGYKLPLVMNRIFMETTWTLTPTFTELAAREDRQGLARLFFIYLKFITILFVPLGLLLIFMARPIIFFWVGEGFETAALILPVLAFPLLSSIPLAVAGCVLNAYGKVELPARASLLAAALNLTGAVILGKVLSFGLLGVAFASASAWIFYYSIFTPWYAARAVGLPWGGYPDAFLRPFVWSFLVTGGAFLALRAARYETWLTLPELILLIFLLPLTCYLGAYFTVLNGNERTKIRQLFRQLKERCGTAKLSEGWRVSKI